MSLTREFGSVALPTGVVLYCPQCGEPCGDEGQCKLDFVITSELEFVRQYPHAIEPVGLLIDCRSCGCMNVPPTLTYYKE